MLLDPSSRRYVRRAHTERRMSSDTENRSKLSTASARGRKTQEMELCNSLCVGKRHCGPSLARKAEYV